MKRTVIRSIFFLWSNAEQSKEWLPRRDVTKSRRRVNNVEVNNSATSRRHHVATAPRRDGTSKICISSFNVRTARKLGHREAYEKRHGISEQIETDSEGVPGICTVFHLLDIFSDILMMFLILDILIFSFMMF